MIDDNTAALSLLIDLQRQLVALRHRCALLEKALGIEPGAPIQPVEAAP